MSEAAIVFRKFTFTHDGKTWELDRPNLNTEAGYSRYLRKKVIDGLNADRELLGESWYQNATRGWGEVYALGTYNYGSAAFFGSLADPTNVQSFLAIWWAQNYSVRKGSDDEMILTEKDFHELWKTRRDDFAALINEMLADGNPSMPKAG